MKGMHWQRRNPRRELAPKAHVPQNVTLELSYENDDWLGVTRGRTIGIRRPCGDREHAVVGNVVLESDAGLLSKPGCELVRLRGKKASLACLEKEEPGYSGASSDNCGHKPGWAWHLVEPCAMASCEVESACLRKVEL